MGTPDIKEIITMRECGMLLPVASLPSRYGIGAFSKEAYDFIDTLKAAGQSFWQILPLGPTGFGDSPYQSFSAFAGNPYFIDLEKLTEEGLLTREECLDADFGNDERDIDYKKIYDGRFPLLRKAYERWKEGRSPELVHELAGRKLGDETREYCFYMAVKNHFDSCSWNLWDEGIRLRKPEALEAYRAMLTDEIGFYEFQQIKFEEQWDALKRYAHEQGIRIIGDIPIYVAFDSADSWSRPELFQFDENNMPGAVAGCPPDGFSATGQLWGNPLYNWEYHRKTGFAWWMRRMEYCFRMYDLVRVDHFRGFDEYYAIPYGDATAEYGRWEKGPGIEIFRQMQEHFGGDKLPIIAEDLGFLTPTVRRLLKDTGFPGMKVLQFAFDSREDSNYLPHTYTRNCVVYTGTHDNDTTKGWYHTAAGSTRQFAKEYMYKPRLDEDTLAGDFIAMAMGSAADLCIVPMQDYLGLGSDARINTPSTLGGNWEWRMKPGEPDEGTVREMERMTKIYGRLRFT